MCQLLQEQVVQLQNAMQASLAEAQNRVQIAEAAMQQQAAEAQARVIAAESLAQQVLQQLAGFADMATSRGDRMEPDGLAELRSIIDIRTLEKMEHFSGKNIDFEEWVSTFEAQCGLIGLEELMVTATSPETTEDDCALSSLGGDEIRIRAKAFWYLLMQLCKGKARSIVKKAETFNGAVAWKRLVKEYQPSTWDC